MKMFKGFKGAPLILLGGIACLLGSVVLPLNSASAGACSKSAGYVFSSSPGATVSMVDGSIVVIEGVADSPQADNTLICVARPEARRMLGLDAEDNPTNVKATLCHIPPGNASALHTITVGQPSVHAHLAHGDVTGPCPGWVTASLIDQLPGCAAIDASGASLVSGVWLPVDAANDASALHSYFSGVQDSSLSGQPDSASYSYREIHAQ